MTIAPSPEGGWIKRLPPFAHQVAIVASGLLLILTIGAALGFGVAAAEDHKSISFADIVILLVLLLLVVGLAVLTWRLTAIWRRPGRSRFEQRYTRMWLILVALGLPGGLALGLLGDFGSPSNGDVSLFSNDPLAPGLALAVALLLGIGLIGGAIIYHRVIDDHEERAYLWGSSVGFHFLVTILPVAWLLARGGIIAPLGTGSLALFVILSIMLQGAVAVWLKYR